jgi:hypothetical protein
MEDRMMVSALPWALAFVALLATLGATAAWHGTDSRDSFVDDMRR